MDTYQHTGRMLILWILANFHQISKCSLHDATKKSNPQHSCHTRIVESGTRHVKMTGTATLSCSQVSYSLPTSPVPALPARPALSTRSASFACCPAHCSFTHAAASTPTVTALPAPVKITPHPATPLARPPSWAPHSTPARPPARQPHHARTPPHTRPSAGATAPALSNSPPAPPATPRQAGRRSLGGAALIATAS